MARTDGDYRVSRILLDGSVTSTFYEGIKDAKRDFYGRDGWPPIDCHFAVLLAKIADVWIPLKKHKRSFY